MGATYQRSKFQEILGAMQMAEDEVNSISKIARSTVNSQAFQEITNFIRNNGDDWGEFCHNTSHP